MFECNRNSEFGFQKCFSRNFQFHRRDPKSDPKWMVKIWPRIEWVIGGRQVLRQLLISYDRPFFHFRTDYVHKYLRWKFQYCWFLFCKPRIAVDRLWEMCFIIMFGKFQILETLWFNFERLRTIHRALGSRRWNWKFREKHFWNPNLELLLHSTYSCWP